MYLKGTYTGHLVQLPDQFWAIRSLIMLLRTLFKYSHTLVDSEHQPHLLDACSRDLKETKQAKKNEVMPKLTHFKIFYFIF